MNLGTLGGGNHFIELQKSTSLNGNGDPDGGSKVWLMIHSGSRNLGKRIEEHYHKIANRLCTRFRVPLADPDLAFLPIEEADGHYYFTDMLFALRYAKENRRRMMEAMKETVAEFVPEVNFLRTIDIHHNYAACAEDFGKIILAYEPVWAIGTGKTATDDQAQEMHAFIRQTIAEKYGKEVADNTSILYGGSCKPTNARQIFAKPDVDGGLIGGASLKCADFMGIVEAFD